MELSNFAKTLDASMAVVASLKDLEPALMRAAQRCAACLNGNGKLLVCGNGGSAAHAMHLVGELVGRYKGERRPMAALSLGTDPALATCLGNDYSFNELFSRQFEALARPEDVLVAFSTSGCSQNVIAALKAANAMGVASIAFLGNDGGPALSLATEALVVRHSDTARIQEGHQVLVHCLMDLLEVAVGVKADA
jgi:D-sedoheptulose 7-phosphate isomerase